MFVDGPGGVCVWGGHGRMPVCELLARPARLGCVKFGLRQAFGLGLDGTPRWLVPVPVTGRPAGWSCWAHLRASSLFCACCSSTVEDCAEKDSQEDTRRGMSCAAWGSCG